MADYTEKLARDIRKELGKYNDPDQPVVLIVRNLRTRIAELEEALREARSQLPLRRHGKINSLCAQIDTLLDGDRDNG